MMEPQVWIGIQIFIDLIMVAVLAWFLRSHSRIRMSWQDHEMVIQKAESILAEMRQISQALETNLQEKKELGKHILAQLDQGLERAEETYLQISKLNPRPGHPMGQADPMKDADRTRSTIHTLLRKGLSREEIAQQLGISVGEIELLLKLQPRRDNA
jgi:hypothetical protein